MADKSDTFETEKRVQLLATLQWVDENYERFKDVCVPRCLLYQHYQDFCQRQEFTCVGPANFGKIIRQKFPKLTTRRLGTRGQSRYHYYGIRIKNNSPYYDEESFSKTRLSATTAKTKETSIKRKYLSSKTATLSLDLPSIEAFQFPPMIKDKMDTFLTMYRKHCQRILDSVIAANFDDVQNLTLHFWHEMPPFLVAILHQEALVPVIISCDTILYKTITGALIPSAIQEIPESLRREIGLFANRLPKWLQTSLEYCPELLMRKKLEVARWFTSSLCRRLSFINLAQVARAVVSNVDVCRRMADDLSALDLSAIQSQMAFATNLSTVATLTLSKTLEEYEAFLKLLKTPATHLEDLVKLIDDVIENYRSVQLTSTNDVGFGGSTTTNDHFVLQWSYFTSLVARDLTIRNSKSFGSVHIMRLMFDEYVHLVFETEKISSLTTACLESGFCGSRAYGDGNIALIRQSQSNDPIGTFDEIIPPITENNGTDNQIYV